MPKILAAFLGYAFYFWANEGLEPIHIHVSKGTQTPNATPPHALRATFFMLHKNFSLIFKIYPNTFLYL